MKKISSYIDESGLPYEYTAADSGKCKPSNSKNRIVEPNIVKTKRPFGNYIELKNVHDNAKNRPESWADPYLRYMDIL